MGACATKVNVVEPQMKRQSTDERIGELLCLMNAHYYSDVELLHYYRIRGGTPHLSKRDRILLEKIMDIIQIEPSRGYKTVGYFIEKVDDIMTYFAARSELHMIEVLKSNPELMEWFINFDVINSHPNLEILSTLVAQDGHSVSSFVLCCQSVKRRLALFRG